MNQSAQFGLMLRTFGRLIYDLHLVVFRRRSFVVIAATVLMAMWITHGWRNQGFNPLVSSNFRTVLDCHMCGYSPVLGAELTPIRFRKYCQVNGIGSQAIPKPSRSLIVFLAAQTETSLLLFDKQDEPYLIADVFPNDSPEHLALIAHSFTPTVISLKDAEETLAIGGRLFLLKIEGSRSRNQGSSGSLVTLEPSWAGRFLERPLDEVQSEVTILNSGRTPIVTAPPRSSCSCTTIMDEMFQPIVPPNGNSKFVVKLRGNASVVSRQLILVPIQQSMAPDGDSPPVQLIFPIYSWQRASLSISADRIDFGSVSRADREAERSLILSEQETDTFEIQSVTCSAEFVHASVVETGRQSSQQLNNKLPRNYRVRFTLSLHSIDGESGSCEAEILTTSKLRPKIIVPIKWKIEPAVRAYVSAPPDLSIVPLMRKTIFTVISSNSELVSLKLLSAPPYVKVSVPSEPFRFKTTIAVSPKDGADIPMDTEITDIRIEVTGDGWKESLQIGCDEIRSLFGAAATDSVCSPIDRPRFR